MTRYSFGDIVIIAFPYTNLNNIVSRPAMVIMDRGDEDVIVARITSQKRDVEGEIEIHNWREKGLLKQSYVRLSKIATLNRKDLKKRLSSMDPEDIRKAKQVLKKMLDLE